MEIQERLATHHLWANQPDAIQQTASYVRTGQLVVIPTDTVYGVGCAALNEAAIRELYRVKQRPFHKAIPVLLADLSDLPKVARYIPDNAKAYMTRYWPGPLTIVLPRRPDLPAVLSPDDTIAVRIPNHEVARAVIRAAGGVMAVTSANTSGQPAAETAEQALAYLDGLVTAVLDDGRAPMGQASAVIDCTGDKVVILREGPVAIF